MTEKKPVDKSLSIHQRIHKVMKDVDTIQKESKKVNNQYTFVSHDEVSRVMHKAFVDHGIVMIPTVTECTENSYSTTVKKKKWGNETPEEEVVLISKTSVKMEISLVNVDNPSDKVTVSFPGMGIDNQDKGIGKAISYAVKYALLKTFCLETSDDVEKDNIDYKPETSLKPQQEIKPKTRVIDTFMDPIPLNRKAEIENAESYTYERLMDLIKKMKVTDNKIKEWLDASGVYNLEHLGYEKTKDYIIKLEELEKVRAARGSGI